MGAGSSVEVITVRYHVLRSLLRMAGERDWRPYRGQPLTSRDVSPDILVTLNRPGPGRVHLDVGTVERAGPGPGAGRAPEGSGQRPRRSGSLEAIRAATAAWLGLTYRCRVASRLWPLMAISRGALTFASPRGVSREWRSWCSVLPPE